MPRPDQLELTSGEKLALERLANDPARPPREVLRARIVLLAAEGASDGEVAELLGSSRPTVALWRNRYATARLEGLRDKPRPGRPRLLGAASSEEDDAQLARPDDSPRAAISVDIDHGDETLEHLLEAACRTISKRGFAYTRVADIAAEAGVSPATVHYHFKTRQDILVKALLWANGRLVGELEQAGEEGDAPLLRMARFLERTVPYPGTQEDEYRLEIDIWSQARHHPGLLRPYEAFAERWVQEVTDIISSGVASGDFTITADSDEVARRLVALTDGLAAQAVIGSSRMPPERVRKMLLRFAAEQLGVDVTELDRHAEIPRLRARRKR